MVLRVVLADDNFLVREGIAALLAEVDDIELVDSVADPQSLLKSVAEHHPDAVLTDIRMPPTHTTEGIDAAKQIRADHPVDRRRRALPVRRGGLRLRAARRRRRRVSATCSRSGSPTSTSSCAPCTTSRAAARPSTRRSSRA